MAKMLRQLHCGRTHPLLGAELRGCFGGSVDGQRGRKPLRRQTAGRRRPLEVGIFREEELPAEAARSAPLAGSPAARWPPLGAVGPCGVGGWRGDDERSDLGRDDVGATGSLAAWTCAGCARAVANVVRCWTDDPLGSGRLALGSGWLRPERARTDPRGLLGDGAPRSLRQRGGLWRLRRTTQVGNEVSVFGSKAPRRRRRSNCERLARPAGRDGGSPTRTACSERALRGSEGLTRLRSERLSQRTVPLLAGNAGCILQEGLRVDRPARRPSPPRRKAGQGHCGVFGWNRRGPPREPARASAPQLSL